MNTFGNFVTVLAWFFGVWSLLLVIARIWCRTNYSDLEQAIDGALNGGVKHFPLPTPTIIAIICWSWVLAPHMK
jgi:hypothetical protein